MKYMKIFVSYLVGICSYHPPAIYPKDGCLFFPCGKCENVSCLLFGLRGNKHLTLTRESYFPDFFFLFFFFNMAVFIDLYVLAILKDVLVTAVLCR